MLHGSNEQCFCCTSCADTKLASRTLRLAIRYIKFLMEILEERDQETISNSFQPDLPGEENTESSVSLITGHLLINYEHL